jgi:hypothetical protein
LAATSSAANTPEAPLLNGSGYEALAMATLAAPIDTRVFRKILHLVLAHFGVAPKEEELILRLKFASAAACRS